MRVKNQIIKVLVQEDSIYSHKDRIKNFGLDIDQLSI